MTFPHTSATKKDNQRPSQHYISVAIGLNLLDYFICDNSIRPDIFNLMAVDYRLIHLRYQSLGTFGCDLDRL